MFMPLSEQRVDYFMSSQVTIGVCVKNSERTIKEAVESVINQKYPAELVKVVIVDGCSKDKTMSIVANITAKTSMKVETYSDNGRGLGIARQIVVNKANGQYIIFTDGDVNLFDDFVKAHVKFMEENPLVGVAFGKPMYQEGTLVSSVWNLYQFTTGGFLGNDATIYRAETLMKVGEFDPNNKGAGEDQEIINRIQEKGWLVCVNSKAKFFHKNRENLKDFMDEQSWFGYGKHYFSHKTNQHPTWRQNLIMAFGNGLKMAFKAYRQTCRKISFLIPLQLVIGNTAWWFGYVKGHINGYGHRKSV
jgi:glycosyltransferase involved in cell wall biosynthesis